jgi:FdhD protein
MCTPVDLEALAVGFLYNEDIIQSYEDIASLRVCPGGDNIEVWSNIPIRKPDKWIRTTGCSGGETSIDVSNLTYQKADLQTAGVISPQKISSLIVKLLKSQDLYRKFGGVHSSALCDGDEILLTAEDIGRHNTLDKISGKMLMNRTTCKKKIVLTTGRISSEMIQKTGRMGASIVISRTSPTSLSIRLAEILGITVIGYARREGFKIYTYPERILPNGFDEMNSSEGK